LLPRVDRDGKLLQEILEENLAAWKAETPPPARDVFDREAEELRQTARIFLIEEETFCETSRPAHFEVAIGLPPDRPGESLDLAHPVEVRLPGGKTFRARGRIDRLDEVQGGDGKHFGIWDYKTGSSWGFARDDPFQHGRRVQNALYLALADVCLRKGVSPEARAVEFGYFFPNRREHGERIAWPASELAGGGDILQRLCRMIALGCFPFTDDPSDVRYSDYAPAFGDAERMAQEVQAKLANTENEALEPFRELRGDATEDPV